jgi:hypothetical protein
MSAFGLGGHSGQMKRNLNWRCSGSAGCTMAQQRCTQAFAQWRVLPNWYSCVNKLSVIPDTWRSDKPRRGS